MSMRLSTNTFCWTFTTFENFHLQPQRKNLFTPTFAATARRYPLSFRKPSGPPSPTGNGAAAAVGGFTTASTPPRLAASADLELSHTGQFPSRHSLHDMVFTIKHFFTNRALQNSENNLWLIKIGLHIMAQLLFISGQMTTNVYAMAARLPASHEQR